MVLLKFKLILALVFVTPSLVQSDTSRLEVPSSFNPVGSGARALGMGGAFIPVADDATAASWNPAGLMQLEKPEFSIAGDWTQRGEDNTFATRPEGSHEGNIDGTRLNYLSVSYPFPLMGYNMIVSLNYQNLFEFSRKWDFHLTQLPPPDPKVHYSYDQDGAIYAMGLAYAIDVSPSLSLGLTVNLWEDFLQENSWQQHYHQDYTVRGIQFSWQQHDKLDFSGVNFNLGMLWEVWRNQQQRLVVGAILKTPFDADITHTVARSTTSIPGSPLLVTRDDETLKMPMSYGLGVAFYPSQDLTLAVDVYRTEWSRFALVGSNGVELSPISGRSLTQVEAIDDTLWVRAGVEYLLNLEGGYRVPLRTGLFYDPAPAEGSPDEFYGFTLGSGIGLYDSSGFDVIFDLSYQYRIGNGVGKDSLPGVGLSQDVVEHKIGGSLIVHLP